MEDDGTMGLKPTCREVHRLTSEQLDRELTLIERARIRLHLLVCEACRNFGGQMDLIRRAMRQFLIPDDTDHESKSK